MTGRHAHRRRLFAHRRVHPVTIGIWMMIASTVSVLIAINITVFFAVALIVAMAVVFGPEMRRERNR